MCSLAARWPRIPPGTGALHLAIQDVGISIGNAPRVHGLRLNWRDLGLERVNGIAFTVLGTEENASAVIRGVGATIYSGYDGTAWVSDMGGIGISPLTIQVGRSYGVLVAGGLGGAREEALGVQIGGLGLALGNARGIQAGGLLTFVGDRTTGLTFGGLLSFAEVSMTGLNSAGAVLRARRLYGVNVGGIVFGDESVYGINVGSIVAAERLRGISAGVLVGGAYQTAGLNVGGLVFGSDIVGIHVGALVAGFTPDPVALRGLATAAATMTDDLTGVSISGVNQVRGVQLGVTIGVLNYARELHGVQIGVLNMAENNSGLFRLLPVVNAHFGD